MSPADARRAEQPTDLPPQGSAPITDQKALERALFQGERRLAQRSDLIELHKRLIARAETDRSAIDVRLDGLEEAVNRIEARLYVELEPLVAQAVRQGIGSSGARGGRSFWWRALTVAAVTGAFVAGSVFSPEISGLVDDLPGLNGASIIPLGEQPDASESP